MAAAIAGFEIRPEFAELLPDAEDWRDDVLLEDIRKNGVIDPLKVWIEENVLLDGHRRSSLLEQHPDILDGHNQPEIHYLSFKSAAEAKSWVIGYQNGRRNVSKVSLAITEGLKVENKQGQRNDLTCDISVTSCSDRKERSRNKQAAEGWQEVAKADPEAAQQILSDEQTPVTQKDLRRIATAPEEAKPELAKQVADKASKPHVANNSGENEWYTPTKIVDLARRTMGGIDLDPASSKKAQETVLANRYFTKEDDGLDKDWTAPSVWLNPPYSKELVTEFSDKLLTEYRDGRVEQACVLVNNATETVWFQRLAFNAKAICFFRGRIKFLDSTGTPANTPLQGQAMLYFGKDSTKFAEQCSEQGFVMEVTKDA